MKKTLKCFNQNIKMTKNLFKRKQLEKHQKELNMKKPQNTRKTAKVDEANKMTQNVFENRKNLLKELRKDSS